MLNLLEMSLFVEKILIEFTVANFSRKDKVKKHAEKYKNAQKHWREFGIINRD